MNSQLLPRALGVATLGYGGYTLSRPQSLSAVAGLADRAAPTRASLALGRLVGIRDLLSGTAMITAPAGTPLRAAIIARVACDVTDAIGLSASAPRSFRPKVLAVTLGWAAVCAASVRWSGASR